MIPISTVTTEKNPIKTGKKEDRRYQITVILIILSALLLSFVVSTFFFQLSFIDGDSMSPTLEHGNFVLINKRADFSRGDVIVFRKEKVKGGLIVKRVWGFPGDTLEIKNGELIVNGKSQLTGIIGDDFPLSALEDGQFFVLGDNSGHSKDSRSDDVGIVTRSEIKGRVIFRLLPFSTF